MLEGLELYYAIIIFLLSLCVGSFLNVCIYRIPNEMSLSKPGSHCPNCKTRLKWYDLFPLFSWLSTMGKCRYCKKSIPIRYPFVELITAIIGTMVFLKFGMTYQMVIGLLLTYTLIPIIAIDFDHQIIPDQLNLLVLILAISQIVIQFAFGFEFNIWSNLLGCLLATVFLVMFAVFGAMGGGDVKLMFSAGLLLGLQNTIVSLFIGIILGGMIGLFLLVTKLKGRKEHIAFGPYLAIGIWLAYLYGNEIVKFYFTNMLHL